MGPLQPGMSSPTMLPKDWDLVVTDRKDCFFQTPLHPEDAPRFAFLAVQSHRQFHQNIPGLVRQFHLRRDEAKAIVATCPECSKTNALSLGNGVNPRGWGAVTCGRLV
ncbi:POK18 protein, partial [Vireo altiloquus]|nr:POK18 protein [Vireo altiloquus]